MIVTLETMAHTTSAGSNACAPCTDSVVSSTAIAETACNCYILKTKSNDAHAVRTVSHILFTDVEQSFDFDTAGHDGDTTCTPAAYFPVSVDDMIEIADSLFGDLVLNPVRITSCEVDIYDPVRRLPGSFVALPPKSFKRNRTNVGARTYSLA